MSFSYNLCIYTHIYGKNSSCLGLGCGHFFCCGRAIYRFYSKNMLINNNENLLTLNMTKKQAILCIGVEINEKFMYICSRLVSCREVLCEPWFHGRRGGLHTGEQAFALRCCCAWWLDVLSHSSATAAAAGQESSAATSLWRPARIPVLDDARCAPLMWVARDPQSGNDSF